MRRAYGSEPILFEASPITTPPLRQQKTAQWRKVWAIVAVLVIVTGGLVAWLLLRQSAAPKSFIPLSVQEVATFPLLEPRKLPAGFALDSHSFQPSETLITFSLTYENDKKLIVSEQPVPSNFDFDQFYQEFENRKDVSAPVGSISLGRFEEVDLASIVSGNTWVLVRAPNGIDAAVLQTVSESFKRIGTR